MVHPETTPSSGRRTPKLPRKPPGDGGFRPNLGGCLFFRPGGFLAVWGVLGASGAFFRGVPGGLFEALSGQFGGFRGALGGFSGCCFGHLENILWEC